MQNAMTTNLNAYSFYASQHIERIDPRGTMTACQVIMQGYRDGFPKGQMIAALFLAEGHRVAA